MAALSAAPIHANADGTRKKETTMARRKLTEQEMLKGVEKALASKKCPPQLLPGLQRRATPGLTDL
jgi:hypothetical protein